MLLPHILFINVAAENDTNLLSEPMRTYCLLDP